MLELLKTKWSKSSCPIGVPIKNDICEALKTLMKL